MFPDYALSLWVLQIFSLHYTYGLMEGTFYKVGSFQVDFHCINHSYTVNSTTECACLVSQLSTYGYGFMYRSGMCHGCRATSQYPKRRLFVRSRKVSKPRDLYLELSDRSEI